MSKNVYVSEVADDGQVIAPDSVAHTYGYSGSNLVTDTVVVNGITYVKTFTYTGDNLTGATRYEAQ